MRVADLEGAELDYWVARALGYEYIDVPPDAEGKNAGRALVPSGLLSSGWLFPPKGPIGNMVPPFSTDWAHGGPIIERERIAPQSERFFQCAPHVKGEILVAGFPKFARDENGNPIFRDVWVVEAVHGRFEAETYLAAAMRAYVASKFGREVMEE